MLSRVFGWLAVKSLTNAVAKVMLCGVPGDQQGRKEDSGVP